MGKTISATTSLPWFIVRKLSGRAVQHWISGSRKSWVCYGPSELVQRPENDMLRILLGIFICYFKRVCIIISQYFFQIEFAKDNGFITTLFLQLSLLCPGFNNSLIFLGSVSNLLIHSVSCSQLLPTAKTSHLATLHADEKEDRKKSVFEGALGWPNDLCGTKGRESECSWVLLVPVREVAVEWGLQQSAQKEKLCRHGM